jgi:glyceraldehyde 3-phosphate dehydrogenase
MAYVNNPTPGRNSIWLGVNGFGRIGRQLTRLALLDENAAVQLVAINDPNMTAESIAYCLSQDTIYGRFPGTVRASPDGKSIQVTKDSTDSSKMNPLVAMIAIFSHVDTSLIPWSDTGADFIVECSGKNCTTQEALSGHMRNSSVKKVIFSCPPKDNTPQFVPGVNLDNYKPNERVISCASCTTNCLAPLVKVVDAIFGIEEGMFSTVHATTASQTPVDSTNAHDVRLGRSCVNNIIPASTGATKSLSAVYPSLQGKITGTALRVPVTDVSVLELTVRLKNPCDIPSLGAAIKGAAQSYGAGIIDVTQELLVSSDFIGDARSCVVDLHATTFLNDKFVKITAWYDNEAAYAARLIDLCVHTNEVDRMNEPTPMITA